MQHNTAAHTPSPKAKRSERTTDASKSDIPALPKQDDPPEPWSPQANVPGSISSGSHGKQDKAGHQTHRRV